MEKQYIVPGFKLGLLEFEYCSDRYHLRCLHEGRFHHKDIMIDDLKAMMYVMEDYDLKKLLITLALDWKYSIDGDASPLIIPAEPNTKDYVIQPPV